MQDAPIHCPADVDATEVEQKACEVPQKPEKKPGDVTVQSGGGGGSTPPTKPPVKD